MVFFQCFVSVCMCECVLVCMCVCVCVCVCVCILEVDGFIISVKINFKSAAILLKQYMETARRATEIMQLLQF